MRQPTELHCYRPRKVFDTDEKLTYNLKLSLKILKKRCAVCGARAVCIRNMEGRCGQHAAG